MDEAKLPERLAVNEVINVIEDKTGFVVVAGIYGRNAARRRAIMDRLAASYNDTRGIPVAALEAGVVGELVAYAECQEATYRYECDASKRDEWASMLKRYGFKTNPGHERGGMHERWDMLDFVRDMRRAILAKLSPPAADRQPEETP